VLLGVETTCCSPVVMPLWLYQMPPFVPLPAPEIQTSTPSRVVAPRQLSPLSPVSNFVDVLMLPAMSIRPAIRLPTVLLTLRVGMVTP